MKANFIHCVAIVFIIRWVNSRAQIHTDEKIDLSKLEFEDLETEENRDAFLRNLDTYEITYPEALEVDYKLTEKHRRLRRDVSDNRPSYYQINAFGKKYELELHNSESILPGARVEYHKKDGIQTKLLSKNTCLRLGKVTNVNATSSAALSDCDGLAGLVQTPDGIFFIEPMKAETSGKPSKLRPHLIYQTKDLPKKLLAGDHPSRESVLEPLLAAQAPSINSPLNRRSRVRRDIWDSFISVVNKAQRSVQLHWLDLYGNRRYFVTLGPNQRRAINTYANTKWVAVDESSQKLFLMNGNRHYLTRRNDESYRGDVVITVPEGMELHPVTSNDIVGDDKWIEALVVADQSVVNFHGKSKVEKYLLILSNMISLIMKDKSIGVRINFVLTRLVILQRAEPSLRIYRKNPSKSVQSACDYAASIQRSIDDSHGEHHDFALVLTRYNFGPAGYAPVYTMCTRTRSCALVDDNGFPSAFIAAHEAGHTLGLGHDGDENKCKSDARKGSVMAPLVTSKLSQFHWSPCSRKTMQENIGYFKCLNDRPHPKNFKYLNSLPGVFITMDEQCRHGFGSGFEKCEYYTDGCQRLWCTESRKRYQSCTTKRRPPLDGTSCGRNKWCRRGRCVQNPNTIFSSVPEPIDGNWGTWQRWSKCSLSCGTGVRYRKRKCDNPKPAHRGKECAGSSVEHAACNTQSCRITKTFEDIRSDHCKTLYGRDWTLYKDSEFTEKFQDRLYTLDCNFETGLNNWKQDRGDRFDWKITRGRTPSADTGPESEPSGNQNGRYAFIEASDNFRARRRIGDNARLLSPQILLPRACLTLDYHMYGRDMGALKIKLQWHKEQKVIWEKSGNQGNEWKKLQTSIESTKGYSIIIEAVRGAHYTSDVAIDNIRVVPGLCEKEAEAKNPCIISCMSQDKRRFILDKTVFDGTRCYNNKSNDICLSGKCKKFGCDGEFNSDKVLDDCNVCGGDGSACNAVEGTKNIQPLKDYEKILELDQDVTNFILEDSVSSPYKIGVRVPGSVRDVYLAAREGKGYFDIGGATLYFSNHKDGRQMISSTGPFKQPLEAVLYAGSNEVGNHKKEAELRYRYFLKKSEKELYRYEVKKWGTCSKRCNGGVQSATLKCVRNKIKEVHDRYCSHLEKKKITRACNVISCKSKYKWVILSWSKCSVSCGSGRQRRIVACVIRSKNKVVPNRICPPPYPKNFRTCNDHPCVTYRWTIDNWGKCSRSCGGGLQARVTNCVRNNDNVRVNARYCKKKAPQRIRKCNLHKCDSFEYFTSAVSKCSRSCGGGLRVRIVNCVNKRTRVRVAKKFCIGPSPPRIQNCNTNPCPEYQWETGKFGACSQSCDGGNRKRDVYCMEKLSKKRVESSLCSGKKTR